MYRFSVRRGYRCGTRGDEQIHMGLTMPVQQHASSRRGTSMKHMGRAWPVEKRAPPKLRPSENDNDGPPVTHSLNLSLLSTFVEGLTFLVARVLHGENVSTLSCCRRGREIHVQNRANRELRQITARLVVSVLFRVLSASALYPGNRCFVSTCVIEPLGCLPFTYLVRRFRFSDVLQVS